MQSPPEYTGGLCLYMEQTCLRVFKFYPTITNLSNGGQHEGVEMKYKRAVIQFEKPSSQIVETESGYEVEKSLGWIKLSADFRKKMLASLKGAKLGVFICICLHLNESGESFPGIDLIAHETGYDRDTVMIAIQEMEAVPNLLKVLRERGKSNKYHPYFVARGAGNNPNQPIGKSDHPTKPVGQPVQKSPTPENLDSKERSLIKKRKKDPLIKNVVVVKGRRAKSKPATTTSADSVRHKNPHFEENLKTCGELGISQPKAGIISDAMPLTGVEVTPEYILQHAATLGPGEVIGLAITRILAGEQPRDLKPGTIIKTIKYTDEIGEADEVDTDYVPEKLVYTPFAQDLEAQANHVIFFEECMECHKVEKTVGIRTGRLCFTCFDEWHKKSLGFYAHPDKWILASAEDKIES